MKHENLILDELAEEKLSPPEYLERSFLAVQSRISSLSRTLPVGQNALTSASFVIMKTRKCNLTYKRFKEGPVALFVNSPSRVTRNTDDKGHKVSFFLYSLILTLKISRTKMLILRQKKTTIIKFRVIFQILLVPNP